MTTDQPRRSVAVPGELQANAWTGDGAATGCVADGWQDWARQRGFREMGGDLWAQKLDPRQWRHPKVGWGVVLADRPGASPEDMAGADDAPEPIQCLVAAREGIVLRYSPEREPGFLRRYYANRSPQDIDLTGAPEGKETGSLPKYLLIYGSPTAIPWSLQLQLNTGRYVGRLDMDGPALERYVEAAVTGWKGAGAGRERTVVWAVDHGADDITHLMRAAVAKPLQDHLAVDANVTSAYLTDGNATGAALLERLHEDRPGVIVTTSHGMTWPLHDPEAMAARLGVPVDAGGVALEASDLEAWQPDGAVWLAHACCSAGAAEVSAYSPLFPEDAELRQTLDAVARVGARVAPLPQMLLAAEKPARGFIGHVEPTFDWTLRQPRTGQFLASDLTDGVYDSLFAADPYPVGLALRKWYRGVGELAIAYDLEKQGHVARRSPLDYAMWCQLAIRDRAGFVLIGDPAATFERAEDDA